MAAIIRAAREWLNRCCDGVRPRTDATMPERALPSDKEVLSWIRERRNWGRWGKDDQKGVLNLVTPPSGWRRRAWCAAGAASR
jgi:hypothetical protein